MIAADTSVMVAYFSGDAGEDMERLAAALQNGDLALPPVVLTELLSSTSNNQDVERDISEIALLPITDGYWGRAGFTRRALKKRGLKAKIADALIAQACIDHDVMLITRDKDFRHFAKHCGLKLA